MQQLPPLPDHIGPLRPDSAFDALIERHPGMWRSPDHKCLTCLGEKTFKRYTPTTGELVEYECDCWTQWMLYVYLLDAGILTHYQRMCWDDVDAQIPTRVTNQIVEYVDHADRYIRAGRGFILRGTFGTGKTLLSVLLLKNLIGRGYHGSFVSFKDLLNSYTDTFRKDSGYGQFRRYLSTDFLVIDEVQAKDIGGMKHVGETMFDHLIRTRIADDKPTIITTNLTMEQIQTGFGHSVINLLAENCVAVEVTGPNFREGKAQDRAKIEFDLGAVRPLVLA